MNDSETKINHKHIDPNLHCFCSKRSRFKLKYFVGAAKMTALLEYLYLSQNFHARIFVYKTYLTFWCLPSYKTCATNMCARLQALILLGQQ